MSTTNRLVDRAPLLFTPFVLCLAAAGAAKKIPFSHAEGDFWDNIQSYLATGHVQSTFLPDTYPYWMGILYQHAGQAGIIAAQAVVYLLLGFCVFAFLQRMLGRSGAAAAGALVVGLDPDLLSSIPKVWDTLPVCLLLMLFTTLALRLSRTGSWINVLLLAVVWGFGTSIRPNLALLIFAALYVLWPLGIRTALIRCVVFGAVGFGVYAAANTVAHGRFYMPSNGSYNAFAGANPYAQKTLLVELNGEGGIEPALHALGVQFHDKRDLWLTPVYKQQARLWVQHHPVQYVWLGAVKLVTLLRPDLKSHPAKSGTGVLKILTSLCVPFWVVCLLWRRGTLTRLDWIVLITAAFYVVPFLLTNSDPRFRVPIDVLTLSHSLVLVLRGRKAGPVTA